MEILLDLRYKVDKEYWGKLFNLKNKEHYIEGIINGYITYMLVCYCIIYKNCKGEDFEGFIFNIFKLGYCIAVKEL